MRRSDGHGAVKMDKSDADPLASAGDDGQWQFQEIGFSKGELEAFRVLRVFTDTTWVWKCS